LPSRLHQSSWAKSSPRSRQSIQVLQAGHWMKWSASLSIGGLPMSSPSLAIISARVCARSLTSHQSRGSSQRYPTYKATALSNFHADEVTIGQHLLCPGQSARVILGDNISTRLDAALVKIVALVGVVLCSHYDRLLLRIGGRCRGLRHRPTCLVVRARAAGRPGAPSVVAFDGAFRARRVQSIAAARVLWTAGGPWGLVVTVCGGVDLGL
jgi:hypothetical protein